MNTFRGELGTATEDSDDGSFQERGRPPVHPELLGVLENEASSSLGLDRQIESALDCLENANSESIAKWHSLDIEGASKIKHYHDLNEKTKRHSATVMGQLRELSAENDILDRTIEFQVSHRDENQKKLARMTSTSKRALFSKMVTLEEEMTANVQAQKAFGEMVRAEVCRDRAAVKQRIQALGRKMTAILANSDALHWGENFMEQLDSFEELLEASEMRISEVFEKYDAAVEAALDIDKRHESACHDLRVSKSTRDELKAEDELLRRQICDMKFLLNGSSGKNESWKKLQGELKNKEEMLMEEEKLKMKLESDAQKLREILLEGKQKKECSAEELKILDDEKEEIERKLEEKQNEIDELDKLKRGYGEFLKLEHERQTLSAEVGRVENELSQEKELVTRVKTQIMDTEKKMEEDKAALDEKSGRLSGVLQMKSALDDELLDAQKSLEEVKEKLQRCVNEKEESSRKESSALRVMIAEAQGKIDGITESCVTIENISNGLDDEINAKKTLVAKKEELLDEIRSVRQTIEHREKQLESNSAKVSLVELDAQIVALIDQREKISQEFDDELKNIGPLESTVESWCEYLAKSKEEIKSNMVEKKRDLDKINVKAVPRAIAEKEKTFNKLKQSNETLLFEIRQTLVSLKRILDVYSKIRSHPKIGASASSPTIIRLENLLSEQMESMGKWEAMPNIAFVASDLDTYTKIFEAFESCFDLMIQEHNDDPVTLARKLRRVLSAISRTSSNVNVNSQSTNSVATDSQRSNLEEC